MQKHRTRINAGLALQIFFTRQISITNFISHADKICNAFIRVRIRYFCSSYVAGAATTGKITTTVAKPVEEYTTVGGTSSSAPTSSAEQTNVEKENKSVASLAYGLQKCLGLED